MLNVDLFVVVSDTLVLVKFFDGMTVEMGITVELLTLTNVTVECEKTVELAAILEDVAVEIPEGPFISMVIVV